MIKQGSSKGIFKFSNYLIVTFSLVFNFSYAQNRGYTSGNPSAIRIYEQATRFYDTRQYDKALEALNAAIEKDSLFAEPWALKGNIYDDLKKYELAVEAYKKSITINADYYPGVYFAIGRDEFLLFRYDEAKEHLMKYVSLPKANKANVERANNLIFSCDFAREAVKHPVPFKPVNMGDSINSADNEYFPAITAEGKTFLFTRRSKITNSYGKKTEEENFFVSHYVKDHWSRSVPLAELNTEGNEGAPTLSADGQYLFFIGCEEMYGYPEGREKGEGSCDIYISKKIGGRFGKARNLSPPINTNAWESQPSFSSDGRTLYFIRAGKEKGGRINHDIYVTFIDDSSNWSEPMPLPANINTLGQEMSVFIHPDNQTLYFASDGHPGMGGLDIFMSKRQADGSWGNPINLGYPINTANDDNSLLVAPSGKTAFFASDRGDSKGGLDLYQFDLPDSLQPQKITYMKGIVYDAETKAPLEATFELFDLATAKAVVRSSSDKTNGEFLVCLPSGKSYALNVSKDGYLFYSDNFELKNPASVKEPFLKDIPLKPIKEGQSIVLKNVFYEVDKYDLKDESRAELSKVISFMKKNPKVKVEISGHTDNTGSKQHNQQLSESRAKTVVDYLIKEGVSKERISSKGYADSKPVATNNTEAGRAQNRRTEFTITSVN